MRLYKKDDKPLRVYIEGEDLDIQRLLLSLNKRFYKETEYSKEDDLDNIIFTEDEEYYFPSGLLAIVVAEIKSLGISHEVTLSEEKEICPIDGISPNLLEGITLREYQVKGIESALTYKKGLLKLPTGAGKTELMIGICKYLLDNDEGNILICVPTANLLHQTYERMVDRGVPSMEVSMYGDGHKLDIDRRVCVATVQTAHRRLDSDEFKEWYSNLKCIIFDEAQHLACRTWYTLIDRLAPEYNLGVSAEPIYGDADHMIRDLILRGTVGPIIYRVSIQYLISKGYLSKPYMIAMNTAYPGDIYGIIDWQVVNKSGVIMNKLRNNLIRDVALLLIKNKKNPLILVSQIKHGDTLARMISEHGMKVAFLTGGLKSTIYLDGREIDQFKDSEGRVKREFQSGLIDVMIGTSTMDEGVDVPVLSSVILAGAGKNHLKLAQRIGRGLRCKPGDNTTLIIDFQDKFNVVLNSQFKKRKAKIDSMNIASYFCDSINNFESMVLSILEQHRREVSGTND